MMSLSDHNDRDLRETPLLKAKWIGHVAGFAQRWNFVVLQNLILAFGHTISVDKDVLEQRLILRLPQVESRFEHSG